MEIESKDSKEHEEIWNNWEKEHRRGKIFGGIVIVAAGFLFLAKELGADIPTWIFSWKMGLMAIGLILGVKHKFLNPGWLVLILIGGAFLANDIYPDLHIRPLVWPVVVILLGLFIIFKPHRRREHRYWKRWHKHHYRHYKQYYRHGYAQNPFEQGANINTSNEDYIDSTAVLGSVQKNIISKNFKGGDISVVCGGMELNLSQADFEGQVTLNFDQVMGGSNLIIPPNWEIKSELVSVMGSIEDKRPLVPNTSTDPNKVLLLRGTVVMGGIEIRS